MCARRLPAPMSTIVIDPLPSRAMKIEKAGGGRLTLESGSYRDKAEAP